MTEWVPGDAKSPDRLDALTHAIVYLMDKPLRSGIQPNNPTAGGKGGRENFFEKYSISGLSSGTGSRSGMPRPPDMMFGRSFRR